MTAYTPQPAASSGVAPDLAPPHVFAGICEQLLQARQFTEAFGAAEKGLKCHPDHADLLTFRAEALFAMNRRKEAEGDLRAAVSREPLHPRAVLLLARILVEAGRWKEAAPFIDRADLIHPNNPEIEGWMRGVETNRDGGGPVAPPPVMAFATAPATIEGVQGLLNVSGVQAVVVRDDKDVRLFGTAGKEGKARLDQLSDLESEVSGILKAIGFGEARETSVLSGDTLMVSRSAPVGSVRLLAESRVREGLLSWHCDRLLGGTGR
jgi:tetratricopeptide (TPR) repeat protein